MIVRPTLPETPNYTTPRGTTVSSGTASIYREIYSEFCFFGGLESVPEGRNAQFAGTIQRIP
jgi:hypothetical protein